MTFAAMDEFMDMPLAPEGESFEPGPEEPAPASGPVMYTGAALKRFTDTLEREFTRARNDRAPIVEKANRAEEAYNLTPYTNDQLPFSESLSLRIPKAVAIVDRIKGEIAGTYDRDGSPIYRWMPNTSAETAVNLAKHGEKALHRHLAGCDAMKEIRTAIGRALKVGVSFLWAEVAQAAIQTERASVIPKDLAALLGGAAYRETDGVENEIVVRCTKVQDTYVSPINVKDLKDAALILERFQLPRWQLDEQLATGYYALPVGEDGVPLPIQYGMADEDHGQAEEFARLGVQPSASGDGDASDIVDLVRGFVRYKPEGAERSLLHHVVFAVNDPTRLFRCQEAGYDYLDRPPVVALNVDEGDGTIWGRGIMDLLADLQQELDTLHMMRVEQKKRAFGNLWLYRDGTPLADEIEKRRGDGKAELAAMMLEDDDDTVDNKTAAARFHPDEMLPAADVDRDLRAIPFTQSNPNDNVDEQRLQTYMQDATVDLAPLGGVRSAFEVRQAAGQAASKLGGMLKVVASTGLRPLGEMLRAMMWEFMMPESVFSEYLRYVDYGDIQYPALMGDYFAGVNIEPSGTTTSADAAVAMTTAGTLMTSVVPLLLQVPVVPDVVRAIREIIKMMLKAHQVEAFEEIIGLTEPTPEQMQKNMLITALWRQAGQTAPTGVGGDGGALMGLTDPFQAQPTAPDTTGGSQGGISPGFVNEMGGGDGAGPEALGSGAGALAGALG